jgi:AcrR family transcriptional regulator
MTATATAPLRKDAARNRQRLLDAAADLFATRGLAVTLNDIAHHAGVGVGTAYRRFANKEELIEALFEVRLQEAVQRAADALDDSDAWHGMVQFLEHYLRLQLEDRGLTELVNSADVRLEKVNRMRDEVAPMVNEIVERAKRQGHLRQDVQGTDMVFMLVGLAAVIDKTRHVAPDLYIRYLDIFLDGLRADRGEVSQLRVPPLSVDDTHNVTTSPDVTGRA